MLVNEAEYQRQANLVRLTGHVELDPPVERGSCRLKIRDT